MFATVWHEPAKDASDPYATGVTHALVCHSDESWIFRSSQDNFKLSVKPVVLDRDETKVTVLAPAATCRPDRLVIADQRGDIIM